MCLCMVCPFICPFIFLFSWSKQAEPLPWWGVKVVVVVECVQKRAAGSWLWNYLEMDVSQNNGLDLWA